MSDLHPTNTMGVEGGILAKTGNQKVTALKREDLEEIEKQRRKASAESNMPLFFFCTFWFTFGTCTFRYIQSKCCKDTEFTNFKFNSSVSHNMDFLLFSIRQNRKLLKTHERLF